MKKQKNFNFIHCSESSSVLSFGNNLFFQGLYLGSFNWLQLYPQPIQRMGHKVVVNPTIDWEEGVKILTSQEKVLLITRCFKRQWYTYTCLLLYFSHRIYDHKLVVLRYLPSLPAHFLIPSQTDTITFVINDETPLERAAREIGKENNWEYLRRGLQSLNGLTQNALLLVKH